jgi:hypothetical protein
VESKERPVWREQLMSSILNKVTALQQYLDQKIDSAPAFIASDKLHAWEILKNAAGVCKIAVGFQGAEARVNFPGGDITGRENQTFYAIISRGRGLNMTRSDNLTVGSGGGLPLFQLAEQMRDMMRAIRFDPTSDEPTNYNSLQQWNELSFDIDAYICEIWVGTQLAQPSATPNNTRILPAG